MWQQPNTWGIVFDDVLVSTYSRRKFVVLSREMHKYIVYTWERNKAAAEKRSVE